MKQITDIVTFLYYYCTLMLVCLILTFVYFHSQFTTWTNKLNITCHGYPADAINMTACGKSRKEKIPLSVLKHVLLNIVKFNSGPT